ncbi:hypothetical protein RJ639_002495 [Escallonia herrerae]|uniref:TITAN-like protein n=1 Tax=Escallonia herrerae TaxID=1293975 RepID=A0AA88XAT3_9ASTE|nr:hypothetical protein RJ639_002495 [Escallonia herrerae]
MKKEKKNEEYEFCAVCKLNHNQGRRHNYFPNHVKSRSAFLTRFQSKLADVRFFLKNPSLLRPEHASRNRLWCVFCGSDIDGLGSTFACGNAIAHLVSADHLKNLKDFLWKYGGGMDHVDSFRLSEVDLARWEKKCKLLKTDGASDRSRGVVIGPVNDIQLNSENIDTFIQSLNSSFSNGVVEPLQIYTNERYQVSHEIFRVQELGPLRQDADSYLHVGTQLDNNACSSNYFTGKILLWVEFLKAYTLSGYSEVPSLQVRVAASTLCSSDQPPGLWLHRLLMLSSNLVQVHRDERTANSECSSQGLQNLTQISSIVCGDAIGNVHSGAPPPWLDSSEGKQLDFKRSPFNKSRKCSKLNPKRVGAAWAERRKVELEMEKRGALAKNFDANWLPNFGRVWQSGSRKESMKEFEVETKKSSKVETQCEMPMQLQPYVSKKMVSFTFTFTALYALVVLSYALTFTALYALVIL